MNIDITMPITEEDVAKLHVGDTVTITGNILCGRDAVLPKVIKLIDEGKAEDLGLKGNLIFHTDSGRGPEVWQSVRLTAFLFAFQAL